MNVCTNCGNRMEPETKENDQGDVITRMICTNDNTVSPWIIEKSHEVQELEDQLASEHSSHTKRVDNCPKCWDADSPFEQKGEV